MAVYSAVTSGEKDPESPIDVSLIDKLDQNPEAMIEGAAGAPRVQTAALDDYIVTAIKIANSSLGMAKFAAPTTGTTYVLGSSPLEYSTTALASCGVFSILKPGAITLTLSNKVFSGTGTTYVYKNGSLVTSWTATTSSYVARSVNITVAAGDIIHCKHSHSAASTIYTNDVSIKSGTDSLAAPRIEDD